MKKHRGYILIVCMLVLTVFIAGCAVEAPPPQETPAAPETPEPAPGPDEDPADEPAEEPAEEPGEVLPEVMALAALFPEREGYRWVYSGFAEYGHEMTITGIEETRDRLVYTLEGEVFDMSDGESPRDFSLTAYYTIVPDVVLQDKTAPMMLDFYDHMELIRAPLQEGESWMQTVLDPEGEEINLLCTIERVELDGDASVYTVVYQDQNSPFYERRVIQEGMGVIHYARLYQTDDGDFEITYSLYEDASGYHEE